MKPNSVRIWIFVNGSPAQLTLELDKPVSWRKSGRTEEGWSAVSETYTYDGAYVKLEALSDGSDCDGRLTRYSECQCHVTDLAAGYHDTETDTHYPKWETVAQHQYDEQAVLAGY
jgi:hypothetical protein